MGVRIFPDGREMKSHEPLAVKRRGYRGQRRNLDRYLQRVRELVSQLVIQGFLPATERESREVFELNPYFLRAKALDEQLTPAEFARALIHLAKKRGFKSNRKVTSDSEGKKLKAAIDNLKVELDRTGDRTLGEYLWHLYNKKTGSQSHLKESIKFRFKDENPQTKGIFPTREMVMAEYDAIWESQSRFNPIFTDFHRENIRSIIFSQLPLKPTQKGNCELLPEYPRAPKAHPLFQEFRIRQDLNNLRAVDFANETHLLSDEQYRQLFDLLSTKDEVTFLKMRKELWGKQAEDYVFNLEANDRKKLLGDRTYHAFHTKKSEALSMWWDSLPLEQKNSVIEILVSDLDDEPTLIELEKMGIPGDLAEQLMEVSLPVDYCNLSVEAMHRILPYMRRRMVFSEACQAAGMDHSLEYDGRIFDEGNLPYYGEVLIRESIALNRKTGDAMADEHGKINNPTVHVALNQLRLLVNALCLRYGAPRQIVLELGKEARMSAEKINTLNRDMRKNEELNDKIRAFLGEHGQAVNHENILRTKLWWELGEDEIDRRCVYSGHQISVTELFSRNIEIDHILPKSRTYDDTNANKLLCTHAANQRKGEKTPFEAFGNATDWPDILARANKLKSSKKWRFRSDAMRDFANENEILARMLNDTRYMSRVAMKYMYYICGNQDVWSITGRHTGILRAKWGLNTALGETDAKERTDHRHHAIDAFVIALTTRSLVKHVAERLASATYRQIEKLDPPWPGFNHADFRQRVNSIMVSYKPDQTSPAKLAQRNQTGGALVEETAYGFVQDENGNAKADPQNPKQCLYTVRKGVGSITEKNWESVAFLEHDPRRIELAGIAAHSKGKEFESAVKAWAGKWNIRKVKMVLSMNPSGMIPIRDKSGRIFKYLSSGENLFADIYIQDPSNPNCKWSMEIVNSYNAHQAGFVPQWKKNFPKGKKVMRVYKNDVLALDGPDGKREYRRLRKMTGTILYLRQIHIAKTDTETGEQFSAKQLMEAHACKAGVDVMGRYHDKNLSKE